MPASAFSVFSRRSVEQRICTKPTANFFGCFIRGVLPSAGSGVKRGADRIEAWGGSAFCAARFATGGVVVRDRRKHTRVRARGVVAHVRALDRGFSCQVENVSEGGVFLRTQQLLPGGRLVTLPLVQPRL